MRLVQDGFQIQIEVVAIFLIVFGAHMNISYSLEREDTCVHEMVRYVPPPSPNFFKRKV
jgi:hypothetical protein